MNDYARRDPRHILREHRMRCLLLRDWTVPGWVVFAGIVAGMVL